MSDDKPESDGLVLRREALLPNERSRGLGTVAVVCTMAGVASGLALATTLMAMQVADSMSSRGCPYREARVIAHRVDREHGYLGVQYAVPTREGQDYANIGQVYPNTPAERVGLRSEDRVISVDGLRVRSSDEFFDRIRGMRPGATPSLIVERSGQLIKLRPTLVPWPSVVQ